MSRIIVTEKEHWKQRIEKRVDKALEVLESKHPDFMANVKNNASSRAMEELGIADLTAKRERLTNQKVKLDDDLAELTVAIEEHVLGKAERERLGCYSAKHQLDLRIRRLTERLADEQLAISETGKDSSSPQGKRNSARYRVARHQQPADP